MGFKEFEEDIIGIVTYFSKQTKILTPKCCRNVYKPQDIHYTVSRMIISPKKGNHQPSSTRFLILENFYENNYKVTNC